MIEQVREAVGDDVRDRRAVLASTRCDDDDLGSASRRTGFDSSQHVDHLVDLLGSSGRRAELQPSGLMRVGASRFRAENSATASGCAGSSAHDEADRRRRPVHEPRHDGRGDPLADNSTSSAPRARRSLIRSCPKKIEEGRLDDIRECIGCNVCAAAFQSRGAARRLHAERHDRWRSTAAAGTPRGSRGPKRREDVLVVGAGPAGMECAIVLGKRGMRAVHLVDAGASSAAPCAG